MPTQSCTVTTSISRASVLRRAIMLLVLPLLAVQLWADDPWKKSFKTWSESDIRKILADSPWARRVKRPDLSEKSELKGKGSDDDDKDDEKDDNDKKEDSADTLFIVRWVSSRTLRRASARGQVLRGRIPDSALEQSVSPAPDDFQLVVLGPGMSAFSKATEASLQSKSYLDLKKSKQRIQPAKIEIIRSQDGKSISAIVFHFPKANSAGEPSISPDETEAKFQSKAATTLVEVEFNLQKMKDDSGLDL